MKRVHFVGIGGIGISALAQYFLSENLSVSGSDASRSEITDDLKNKGARVFISHKASNVPKSADLLIYSAAIKESNPERRAAKKLGIRQRLYAEALGDVVQNYFTIAVAGSHGKSTTSAMLSLVLVRAGLDPTVIIGTKLKQLGGNFRQGRSKYLIIEADEYNKSFHQYRPQMAIVTNIDKEHLDTYKTYDGVVRGFSRFLGNVSGPIVANWKSKGVREAFRSAKKKPTWYNKNIFKRHTVSVPGLHNQENAEAVWGIAKLLGIKRETVETALAGYRGAWRRMERLRPLKKEMRGRVIYTDYAHHPTEIRATLEALKERCPKRELVCVFQPHQQDRFDKLFNDFKPAFQEASRTILLPVYKVRGRETGGRKSVLDLADEKKGISAVRNFSEVLVEIKKAGANSVIVFMSAGDLDGKVRTELVKKPA